VHGWVILERFGMRLRPADPVGPSDRSHRTRTAGTIRRTSPTRPPTGRSAPPERLESACRVAGVSSGRSDAHLAGRTVDIERSPYGNVDAPTRGVLVAEKLDRADECEAERR